jgi:YspA, cpYpsA-related SLOG family
MPDMTGVERVLVTGSRDWPAPNLMARVLRQCYRPGIVLVVGDARGADAHAVRVWRELGGQPAIYVADWKHLGRRAGVARNEVMVHSLVPGRDLALAFIFNGSRGATHCSQYAQEWGIKTLTWALSGAEWSAA